MSRPIEDHSGRPISQDGAAEEDIVQVYPQQSTLTISPNHPGEVNFQVKLAEVPVDIYFVLDISNSMSIHKHNLQKSIEQIQEEISRLTSRAMFGFGSFSDKSLPPFSSELPFYERMIQAGQRHQPPPYSFHHQMPLTDDIENFIRSVSETEQAGNVDSPEAGMDALMQVITCNEEIGWRDSVQKVIILITDEDTHFAYDGRLAGLPLPQDGQCHLDKVPRKHVFRYGMELEQDFPSFGQIRGKLKDKNMVVVFAVHPGMDAIYRELSR